MSCTHNATQLRVVALHPNDPQAVLLLFLRKLYKVLGEEEQHAPDSQRRSKPKVCATHGEFGSSLTQNVCVLCVCAVVLNAGNSLS